ncbi:uncharacterized protein FFMR_09350 [Fusarium fujikuroi]|nr:uncharacterized protein FFM5_03367 [Fusarium fujikuroi]SCO48809.1 uncharacterized protein FFMR_09350 [Fusarium fujikuroi]SCV35695.1 uncharacterized protein FFB14_05680 [Fusarium fujikuroi]
MHGLNLPSERVNDANLDVDSRIHRDDIL